MLTASEPGEDPADAGPAPTVVCARLRVLLTAARPSRSTTRTWRISDRRVARVGRSRGGVLARGGHPRGTRRPARRGVGNSGAAPAGRGTGAHPLIGHPHRVMLAPPPRLRRSRHGRWWASQVRSAGARGVRGDRRCSRPPPPARRCRGRRRRWREVRSRAQTAIRTIRLPTSIGRGLRRAGASCTAPIPTRRTRRSPAVRRRTSRARGISRPRATASIRPRTTSLTRGRRSISPGRTPSCIWRVHAREGQRRHVRGVRAQSRRAPVGQRPRADPVPAHRRRARRHRRARQRHRRRVGALDHLGDRPGHRLRHGRPPRAGGEGRRRQCPGRRQRRCDHQSSPRLLRAVELDPRRRPVRRDRAESQRPAGRRLRRSVLRVRLDLDALALVGVGVLQPAGLPRPARARRAHLRGVRA